MTFIFLPILSWLLQTIGQLQELSKNKQEVGNFLQEMHAILPIDKNFWYNFSNIESEDTIYERSSFQRFMDIDITTDQIPDSITMGKIYKNIVFGRRFCFFVVS